MRIRESGRRPFTYFDFRLNIIVSNSYLVDEIVTVTKERKQRIRIDCQKASLYLKQSVYYVDLTCVAIIYLLLVIGLTVFFCMGFLRIDVFMYFPTYERHICFRIDAHSFFPGIMNI